MNYYQLLGLKKNSSTDEIKKIYRKLAIKYHPDKHDEGPARLQANEHFKTLNEAYHYLKASLSPPADW